MSHLAGLLRQITQSSKNPNALIYQLQLERTKRKYLVPGRLGDGVEGAVALEAPECERREKELERELNIKEQSGSESGSEAGERKIEGIESREVEVERMGADGDETGRGKGKGDM
jgi:hypothetical protein